MRMNEEFSNLNGLETHAKKIGGYTILCFPKVYQIIELAFALPMARPFWRPTILP